MQTNEPGTAEQIAALESVVPELAKLERLLAHGNQAQVDALERFAVEPELKRLRDLIEEQRAEFDALDFLRLSNDEEFHSNFLAWLLDPNQNHGMESYFLWHFLLRTGAQVQVDTIDWSGTSVHREWVNEVDGQRGFLDILVLNHEVEFLCAIENKVRSLEHSEQLTRYRKALKERYPHWHRHHVFLSPRGTLPYREEEQEYWTAVDYKIVLQLVEQTISNPANPVKEDVRAFLQQYATTLRRNIVPEANTNIAELVRKIYLEHREAIELIIQHKPDVRAEAKDIFREVIRFVGVAKWELDCEDQNFLRFRSIDWNNFDTQKTGTGWLHQSSDALLLFQINFRDGVSDLPYLDLGLSPGTDEITRQKLFDIAKQRFNSKEKQYGANWRILDQKEYILDESDYANWHDQAKIRAKIEAWVKNFAENEFPAMNDVIINCLREYEAETKNQ